MAKATPITAEQQELNDLSNRISRSTVAIIDTMVTRGAFKGEELTTIGQLRDQAVRAVALYETVSQQAAE